MSIAAKVQDVIQHVHKEMPVADKDPHKENLKLTFSTELFKKLMANAQSNCTSVPKGRTHSEIMKKFSLSLLLMVGPSAYKLINANMPEAFPSLSTVEREASKCYQPLEEGEFLFDKLSAHLDVYNAPRVISISEDATRVISRVEYDGNSDSIIGFVLPLNENALPKKDSFHATSFEEIEQMFSTSKKASNAYIYVAQAMSLSVPPFCLALIGSDNCFDATVVMKRWKYIVKECNLRNIQVISFGSDGDSRLLTSMRIAIKLHNYSPKQYQQCNLINQGMLPKDKLLEIPPSWNSWFCVNNVTNTTFVQDPVHLGVKLKARLLTYSQVLPMGKYSVLSSHL